MTREDVNRLIKKIMAFIKELNIMIEDMEKSDYHGPEKKELIIMRRKEMEDLQYFIDKRNLFDKNK